MNVRTMLLILTSVSLSALAQVCLEFGMSGAVQDALASGDGCGPPSPTTSS